MWVKLKRLRPCASAVAQLDPIPGVGPYLAEALIAEIGIDMRRFPTPAHLGQLGRDVPRQPRKCRVPPGR